MIQHKSSIEINRPVSDVFTFVSNPENIPKWQADVVTSKLATAGPIRTGTQFEEIVKIFGKEVPTVCEVTEYQPTKRFAFRSISPSAPVFYEGHFLFEPNGRGSKVSIDANVSMRGLWKLIEPLFGFEVRKAMQKELNAIKSHLEVN